MSDRQIVSREGFGTDGQPEVGSFGTPARPRVLAVDDDPGTRLLMQETLAKAGFEVRDAASGYEAIELCSTFSPDLVLLDINMPKMDGITACGEIRKQCDREFPIVMVTSVDDAVSIQRAFAAGASDFILKPINWPLFQRRLETVLAEWDRAREFDASNKRVRLLEKVVPEQVMLVSRTGNVIEDLKSREGDPEDDAADTLDDLYGIEIATRFRQRISGVLKTGRHNNLEFTFRQGGVDRDFEAQFLVEGRDRVIVVVQDANRDSKSRDEIYDLAFIDFGTGLPNRHLFERRAEELLAEARLTGRNLAFLSLCFEQFSEEHQLDRDVMQLIGARLDNCLSSLQQVSTLDNSSDAARVARIEPNQFVLIAEPGPDPDSVQVVCDVVLKSLAGSIVFDKGSIQVSPRLGVSAFPADGAGLNSLLRAATSAMNEAMQTGQLVCFNAPVETGPSLDTHDYGEELRRALQEDELELYFQPRVSLADGAITCVEALLRWNHPMRGFVDLREVLNLAKATGLIVPLGDWVLERACTQALRWHGEKPPRVSVNLSQQEFARHGLEKRVAGALDATGLDPARVELELTESALLRSRDGLDDLEALKRLGVALTLDDFGTGHSSLAGLKQYPIDALKIDGSFVRDLPGNNKDAAICEVIVTMAHLLGMQAVAEGVETAEQQQVLINLGCDEAQGYHLCRPMPADEVPEYLVKFELRAR